MTPSRILSNFRVTLDRHGPESWTGLNRNDGPTSPEYALASAESVGTGSQSNRYASEDSHIAPYKKNDYPEEQTGATVFPRYFTDLDKAVWKAFQRTQTLFDAHNTDDPLRNTGKYRTFYKGLFAEEYIIPPRGPIDEFFSAQKNDFNYGHTRAKFNHFGGYFPTDGPHDPIALVITMGTDASAEEVNRQIPYFLERSKLEGIPIYLYWPHHLSSRAMGIVFNAARVPPGTVTEFGAPMEPLE